MAQASLKAGPARPQAAEFNWQDPLDLENHLSEDERMIRDSVRAFAQDRLMPRVQKAFREENFDRADHERAREPGAARRDDGGSITAGPGSGYVAYGLAAREIERVDSGYRSAMSVQNSLVMHPIEAYGNERRRRNICRSSPAASSSAVSASPSPMPAPIPAAWKTRAQETRTASC